MLGLALVTSCRNIRSQALLLPSETAQNSCSWPGGRWSSPDTHLLDGQVQTTTLPDEPKTDTLRQLDLEWAVCWGAKLAGSAPTRPCPGPAKEGGRPRRFPGEALPPWAPLAMAPKGSLGALPHLARPLRKKGALCVCSKVANYTSVGLGTGAWGAHFSSSTQ